jgi:5-methylcytosine-specific restriction endonuclease McrA
VLETVILEKAADGTLAKAIMRKSQRQIDNQVQWRVFRRDKYACRYCGNDACPLTVDHLVTWEDGGPSIEANLLTSCRKCNMIRDTTPYDQWLQHPRYRELSRRLSPAVQADNRALAATLADIPRVMHQRTRK